MARIVSSELHRNDNASLMFGTAIVAAVRNVRPLIAILAGSRKADEHAPGAIHALRKLCEGEGQSGSIYRQEVEEWKACFFKWFHRVKRWFPDEHADEFLANAEEDFRVILECSNEKPEYFWRSDVDERHLSVTFENEQALDAARKAAEEKHPVELGSALHKYIEKCIAALVEESGEEAPAVTRGENAPPPDLLEPRIMMHDDGRMSLRFDRFDCFDAPEELEQDIVTTAYDVEDAVRNYVNAHCTDKAADLEFDCESSMFCVYSAHPGTIATITEVLLRLAADRELYVEYRSAK